MDHKIKLVGFDLDGTLLNSEKILTERTRKALIDAVSQGIVIVPVTGRTLSGVPRELMEFPGVRYVITANGARILDVIEGETLIEELLPREKCGIILDIFEKYDTLKEIYYDGVGYADKESLENIERYQPDAAMGRYICATRKPIESTRARFEAEEKGMDKIQALFSDISDKEKARLEVLAAVSDVEVTGAVLNNVEVNAKGIHKGNALVKLGEVLGIRMEEIMAFGDGNNDIQMLEAVGVGVAMANSVPEVLAVADMVAPSNDEDGVAKVIEECVLI